MIDIIPDIAKLGSKLIDLVSNMCSHMWTKKQAKAEAEAIKETTAANTEALKAKTAVNTEVIMNAVEIMDNNPDKFFWLQDGKWNVRSRTNEEMLISAQFREGQKLLRREQNLVNVATKAKGYLEENTTRRSGVPVDADWRARFINNVQDISSEEMQEIWAKILADEVVTPGTFSLRTLDVVRNISKEEARLFEKLLHVAIIERSTVFTLSNNDMLKRYGINYIDIQRLSESGLINSNYGANYSFEISGNTQRGLCGRDNIIVIVNNHDENVKISLPVYRFTTAGEQLLKCLRFTSKAEYFVECAEIIYKQNNALTVSAHDLITQNGENIIYNPAPIKKFG